MTRYRGVSVARLLPLAVLLLGLLAPLPSSAMPIDEAAVVGTPSAAPGDAQIKLVLRASGLSKPVFITPARDGTGRLFIVEQTGRIKILKDGAVLGTPFCRSPDLSARATSRGSSALRSTRTSRRTASCT